MQKTQNTQSLVSVAVSLAFPVALFGATTISAVGVFLSSDVALAARPGMRGGRYYAQAKPEPTPEAKPEVKAEAKAETKPEPTAEPKPQPKEEAKPVAQQTPEAQPTPAPSAAPRKEAMSKASSDALTSEVKQNCDRHYTGIIQSEIRTACSSAAEDYGHVGKVLAQTRCRLDYGEEPRLVMACLVGVGVTDDIMNHREDFRRKLQLCAEHYPVHNEIDASLQESCLTGIYLPDLMKADARAPYQKCADVTPERSFIGPCSVGLSLIKDLSSPSSAVQQNRVCKQYFDFRSFHAGYRACLTARSLGPDLPQKVGEAMQSCSAVIGDPTNDTERAACLVGLSIYRHLQKQDDLIDKRFQKCGANKVRYDDRDFLACLSAASLLDFSEKAANAEAGCKEIYKTAKSRGRGDCLNSVALFTGARESQPHD